MTNTITITTPRGATIELDGGKHGGSVAAKVNGKPHTSGSVELGHDAEVGHHLKLAGNVRAQINAEDVDALKAFFRTQRERYAEWAANYKLSAPEESAKLTARMSGRHSDY